MSEKNGTIYFIDNVDELQKRYDLSNVEFVPTEFYDWRHVNETRDLQSGIYKAHPITGIGPGSFVQFDKTVAVTHGLWKLVGSIIPSKGKWLDKEGQTVGGLSVPTFVIEKVEGPSKGVTLAYLNLKK